MDTRELGASDRPCHDHVGTSGNPMTVIWGSRFRCVEFIVLESQHEHL